MNCASRCSTANAHAAWQSGSRCSSAASALRLLGAAQRLLRIGQPPREIASVASTADRVVRRPPALVAREVAQQRMQVEARGHVVGGVDLQQRLVDQRRQQRRPARPRPRAPPRARTRRRTPTAPPAPAARAGASRRHDCSNVARMLRCSARSSPSSALSSTSSDCVTSLASSVIGNSRTQLAASRMRERQAADGAHQPRDLRRVRAASKRGSRGAAWATNICTASAAAMSCGDPSDGGSVSPRSGSSHSSPMPMRDA